MFSNDDFSSFDENFTNSKSKTRVDRSILFRTRRIHARKIRKFNSVWMNSIFVEKITNLCKRNQMKTQKIRYLKQKRKNFKRILNEFTAKIMKMNDQIVILNTQLNVKRIKRQKIKQKKFELKKLTKINMKHVNAWVKYTNELWVHEFVRHLIMMFVVVMICIR